MDLNLDFVERSEKSSPQKGGSQTSLRMRYLAEAEILKRELGGLEGLRMRLQISRRKLCQILLVDPSAWTRWARDESKIPPHIWKMLSLLEEHPQSIRNHQLQQLVASQEKQLQSTRHQLWGLTALSLLAFLCSILSFFF